MKKLILKLGTNLEFYHIFRGQIIILSNWKTKLKMSKIHDYTGILPIIHPQFCPESQIMLQGPLWNFIKFLGSNCNFIKLKDQSENVINS
jgi:hypothetical protein